MFTRKCFKIRSHVNVQLIAGSGLPPAKDSR